MKILVLGGSGFIGNVLLNRLANSDVELLGFSRTEPKLDSGNSNVSWFRGDYSCKETLSKALNGVDVVVHCICSHVPSTGQSVPSESVMDDLVPTINLLQEMRRQNISRLLFLSSGGTVYGNPSECPVNKDSVEDITEQTMLSPISYYGALKASTEHFLMAATQSQNLQCTIVRPSNVYGLNSRWLNQLGFITTLIANYLDGETTTLYGGGETIRDYLHVSDLVCLLEKMIFEPVPGIYNAGSGCGHSLNDIIGIVEELTRTKLELSYEDKRPYDVDRIVLNSTQANKTFDWYPEIDLRTGIKKILKDLAGD